MKLLYLPMFCLEVSDVDKSQLLFRRGNENTQEVGACQYSLDIFNCNKNKMLMCFDTKALLRPRANDPSVFSPPQNVDGIFTSDFFLAVRGLTDVHSVLFRWLEGAGTI